MNDKKYNFWLMFSSANLAVASSLILSIILGVAGVGVSIPLFIFGGAAVLTPGIYFGIKTISENYIKKETEDIDKRTKAEMMQYQMFLEVGEKHRKIGKKTANFLYDVKDMEHDFQISLDHQSANYLNDLLYLVNTNYYSEIVKNSDTYSRDRLVKQILNQVGLYIKESGKESISNKDIEKILDSCFFIPDRLKKEIMNEYIKSEVSYNKLILHGIDNRSSDSSLVSSDEKRGENPLSSSFDIDNREQYQLLIQTMEVDDEYLGQFGNPSELDWDIDSLQKLLSIIAKDHHEELANRIDGYSDFNLVSSFIANAACYAIANGKDKVGVDEMASTFRNWEYIPFSLRSSIATDVASKMDFQTDYSFYNSPTKQKTGI